MNGRVGLIFLFMSIVSCICHGRQLVEEMSDGSSVISDVSVAQVNNEKVCTMCEEFATQALEYLAQNKTQKEIVEILHLTCSRASALKKECITLVDHYAPLFFSEVSSVQPAEFCRKVNLCQRTVITLSQFQEDSCGVCQHAVSEVLEKLKDPDTQLDVLEVLLKLCNSIENYAKKCKTLVFQYGPLILMDAAKFLETTDICTLLHACALPTGNKQNYLLSDS